MWSALIKILLLNVQLRREIFFKDVAIMFIEITLWPLNTNHTQGINMESEVGALEAGIVSSLMVILFIPI